MKGISVVIPVYNRAALLPGAVQSALAQEEVLEVLVVDDASTDDPAAALASLGDSRVRCIRQAQNGGPAVARNRGVREARGEFIAFLDSDDRWRPGKLAGQLRFLEEQGAEAVFSAFQRHRPGQAEEDIFPRAEVQPGPIPCETLLFENLMGCPTLLARRELLLQEPFDTELKALEDWELALRLSRRGTLVYDGVCRVDVQLQPESVSTNYPALLAAAQAIFVRYHGAICQEERLWRQWMVALTLWAKPIGADFLPPEVAVCAPEHLWRRQPIPPERMPWLWENLLRGEGSAAAVGFLADRCLMETEKWAGALAGHASLQLAPGPVHRIGALYHGLKNGGVERVFAALAQTWQDMGLEVVLVTEEAPQPGEYPLPPQVQRELIPAFDPHNAANRAERARRLQEIVRTHGLDGMVLHTWADPMLLWDVLALRTAGCRTVVHTHSIFSMTLRVPELFDRFRAQPAIYALTEGAVTLSEADTCYWRHWAPRVWQTANPLPIAPGAYAPSPLSGNRLLWVGRIAPEKHPLEAVEILAAVRRQLPEATLTIVGAGDAALEKQLHQKIQALGLEQAVTCAGYQTELAPYYQQADILLSTSEFEGYALAMAEAQACGVPVVAWSLPHLSLLRSGRGSVSVPQGSVAASAEAVLVWLRHREALTQAGAEALANIQSLQVDQAEVWRGIFRSLEEPAVREAPADSLAMLQSLRGAVIAAHEQAQTPSLPRRIKRRLVRGKRELIFTLARWRRERNMKE